MLRKLCQMIVKTAGIDVKKATNQCQSECEIAAIRSHIEQLRDEVQELHKMSARIQRKVYRVPFENDEGNHQEYGDLSWLQRFK